MARAVAEGELVVMRGQLERGVFRVERILEVDGVDHARVLSYRDGHFSIVTHASLLACPAGIPAAGIA